MNIKGKKIRNLGAAMVVIGFLLAIGGYGVGAALFLTGVATFVVGRLYE